MQDTSRQDKLQCVNTKTTDPPYSPASSFHQPSNKKELTVIVSLCFCLAASIFFLSLTYFFTVFKVLANMDHTLITLKGK